MSRSLTVWMCAEDGWQEGLYDDASVAAAGHRKRLADTTARIDQHTVNSPRMKAARALVADSGELDRLTVELALAERKMPTTAQQERALILGLTPLAWLNRTRINPENRIAYLRGHQGP